MDSLSTGIVRIVIEDPGITAPTGRAASKGGSYDPNASPRASASPERSAPAVPPAAPSMAEKIAAILNDPGARRSLGKGTTTDDVAKMGPAFIDLLFSGLEKKTSPVGSPANANHGSGAHNAREWEVTGHKLATGFLWKALALPMMLDQIGQKLGMGFIAKVNAVGLKDAASDTVRPLISPPVAPAVTPTPRPVVASGEPAITPTPLQAPQPSSQDVRLQELFDQFDKGALFENEQMDELDNLYLAKIGEMSQDDRVSRLRSIIDRINSGERVKDSEWYERDKLGADRATDAAARLPAPVMPIANAPNVASPGKASPWDEVMKNARRGQPFGLNLDAAPEQPKGPWKPQVKYGFEGLDTSGKDIKGDVYAVNMQEAKQKAAQQSGGFVTKVGAPEGAERGWSQKPIASVAPPQARVVSDAEKARDQWKPENLLNDFKNYLPGSIGKKFDAMGSAYKTASAEAGANGAGMAGRAMAGAGEAIVAAGPVAALAAVTVAAHLAAKANQKAADAIEGMGRQAARFAANDHLGMFNAAVDGAKDTLREIPIVGDLYASRLGLAVAPINAMTTAVNAFVARGKELQGYSGPLAGANARAEFRDMLGDIKEAERLGPALARLTDAQSDADREIREIMLPIKEFVATKLAAALEAGMAGWEAVKPLLEMIGQIGERSLDAIEMLGVALTPFGKDFANWVEEEKRGRKLDRQLKDIKEGGGIMEWLGALDNLQLGGGRRPAGEDQRKISGPIFPGFSEQL